MAKNHLIEFQKTYGLVPDGVMGIKTLNKIKGLYHIEDNVTLAHFIGQITHESVNFTASEESFKYSKAGLIETFPRHFGYSNAHSYVGNPITIANLVYANRMGNTEPNDGWDYRGRGAIQLTGKYNYQEYFADLNMPVDSDPNLILTPEHYFRSAWWFYETTVVNVRTVSESDILKVSRCVNFGTHKTEHRPNGLANRVYCTKQVAGILGIS